VNRQPVNSLVQNLLDDLASVEDCDILSDKVSFLAKVSQLFISITLKHTTKAAQCCQAQGRFSVEAIWLRAAFPISRFWLDQKCAFAISIGYATLQSILVDTHGLRVKI
jgi:hypothetical protein